VTSTPDDVFYILKLFLHRLLSTGSLTTLERTLNRLSEVLIRDYTGAIKKKLDDVYANSGNVAPAQRERMEKENRTAFIVGRIAS
jgi:conserved oligomeric Golgi complex subunit 4